MTTLHSVRVFAPSQGTRDGLDFKIEADGKPRNGFITGTGLALLPEKTSTKLTEIFNDNALTIAVAVSRKVATTAEDEEIFIDSDDIKSVK